MLRVLLPSFIKAFLKNIRALYYGYGYRAFGQNSILKSPMRIKGRSFVSIGQNCYIQSRLRLEAVSSWGDISKHQV